MPTPRTLFSARGSAVGHRDAVEALACVQAGFQHLGQRRGGVGQLATLSQDLAETPPLQELVPQHLLGSRIRPGDESLRVDHQHSGSQVVQDGRGELSALLGSLALGVVQPLQFLFLLAQTLDDALEGSHSEGGIVRSPAGTRLRFEAGFGANFLENPAHQQRRHHQQNRRHHRQRQQIDE